MQQLMQKHTSTWKEWISSSPIPIPGSYRSSGCSNLYFAKCVRLPLKYKYH